MPRFDITIAGELNLDLILYGLPEQLSPERELLADGMMLTLGSSSAIVAHNLATLGSRVGFQSRIGDDSLGQIALDRLRESGVDVSRVHSVPGTITTGLTVILQHGAWRNILTYAGTIAETSWQDLDLDALADSRHFHLSSYYLQRGLRPRVVSRQYDRYRPMSSFWAARSMAFMSAALFCCAAFLTAAFSSGVIFAHLACAASRSAFNGAVSDLVIAVMSSF